MDFQDQFIKSLFYNGHSASIAVTSGTNCPCATKYGTYSPEWHSENPTAENCNGTLKISNKTTTYNIKAVFINKIETLATYLKKIDFSEIGELTDYDLLMIGTVNVADMSFLNLSELDSDIDKIRYNTTITVNSYSYIINHIYDINADNVIGQIALLKRKT